MKRIFDIVVASIATLVLFPVCFLVWVAVRLSSPGPGLYWSTRVGRDSRHFSMPKFRSMRTGTPAVATHLLNDPGRYVTPVGRFIRATSLDELPQLWSVLRGDMSIVGPRPALFNQTDLIALRTSCGVDRLRPGITGWAQVNGRDELSNEDKVSYDYEYLQRQSFFFDLQIVGMTVWRVLRREGVRH